MVNKELNAVKRSEDIHFVMGDFNASSSSRTLKAFFDNESLELKSVLEGVEICSTMSIGRLNRQIDYILISEDFEVVTSEIKKLSSKNNFISDHNPIVAELGFK